MNTKPRFGIDIDGTVTSPSTLIPHINKQYNTQLTLDDITQYDFTKAFKQPIDRQAFYAWFKEAEPEMYRVSEAAPYAKEILTAWHTKYELFYISARSQQVASITENWFIEHSIPYDHIELIGHHDKLESAKTHCVDAFFEDKHDNAVTLAEELKIPVVLFDTPYNRLPVPTNVIRVANWQEAKAFIERTF